VPGGCRSCCETVVLVAFAMCDLHSSCWQCASLTAETHDAGQRAARAHHQTAAHAAPFPIGACRLGGAVTHDYMCARAHHHAASSIIPACLQHACGLSTTGLTHALECMRCRTVTNTTAPTCPATDYKGGWGGGRSHTDPKGLCVNLCDNMAFLGR
jgi:hypothetical protein